MTAYSLMGWLAPAILDGSKPHTVRSNGKRVHAKAGDTLQLYTGMRTKDCRLLKTVQCIGSWQVHLPCSKAHGPLVWSINGHSMGTETMWEFAINDGFADVFHMTEWLLKTHGEDFTGTLIAWDWRNYLPGAPKRKVSKCPRCGGDHSGYGLCE